MSALIAPRRSAKARASASAARVLAVSARIRFIADEPEEARRLAESALAMADELELDELRAHALTTIGMTKNDAGDPSGVADMERALELALEIGSPIAATIVNNLAVEAFNAGDVRRARTLYGDSVQLAERLGDRESARFTGTNLIFADFFLGDWDSATRAVDEFIAACEAGAAHANETNMRVLRGAIRRARGDAAGARADHARSVELARVDGGSANVITALIASAAMHAEQDELDEARALVAEALPIMQRTSQMGPLLQLVGLVERLGVRDRLLEVVRASQLRRAVFWRDAAVVALEGDVIAAADLVSQKGAVTIESQLRFRGGQQLIGGGAARRGQARARARARVLPLGGRVGLRRADRDCARRRSERVGVAEREAVGHAGDVVDDLVGVVTALDEVVEDRVDDLVRLLVLWRRLRTEVHALEHEGPQRRASPPPPRPTGGRRRPLPTTSTMSWTSLSIRFEPVSPRIAISSCGRSSSSSSP